MTIVIIDDDIHDIEYCKELLAKNFTCFETVICFTKPIEGLQYLNKHKPDLLIVDVEMPDLNGLDLLTHLKSPNTEVVFCTAHDKFAIEAYRHFAIGFLLKPFNEAKFISTITKALQRLPNNKIDSINNKLLIDSLALENKKIAIPTLGCIYFSKTIDIVRLESLDGYAKIYLVDGTIYLSSYGIKYFENFLTMPLFFRTHKSHLVNLKKIKKFFPDGTLVLDNDEHIPVARRRRKLLLEIFDKQSQNPYVKLD
ncbi:LytR/AlgR family response regulator transcription factor [Flavivirga rizhaonensis]|uniref:Response regulator transcription factor n=1 Tax=Flavivirga rizhaonensis TaxID=2559571 RepID=A0A4S1E3D7_9FLAO|nr:LytTR family DNA-binding domain-containing protein [Flavivirga rizhaonensis]TGV04472.1 response regulator transcription factor [Flavivirga rizhaonensis]